jgi:hypothetical protein
MADLEGEANVRRYAGDEVQSFTYPLQQRPVWISPLPDPLNAVLEIHRLRPF